MRNPFIVGRWVRGEDFHGRDGLLREVLEGERDSLWVVGARRLGKTSVLKELEHRVQLSSHTPYAALYWDLQGSVDGRGLADGLLCSVEDSEAFRRATDVSTEHLEGLKVADMLTTVIRRTVRSGWRLLLLLDEGEELLTVARQEPAVLPRLRRVLQKGPEVRCVLTATRRLARIDERTDFATSPFLQGFIPGLYLTPLTPDESRALLARGRFAAEEVELMLERTAGHPFLLQLIASRLFESHDLAAILDQVAADEMVANFFAVDFQALGREERLLLEEVAREGDRSPAELASVLGRGEEVAQPLLYGLRMLGYLSLEGGRHRIGNWFFERWLRRAVADQEREAPSS